jgi:ribosomal 30S subunit maturation factor RimM
VIVNPETDFPEERFQAGAELFIERGGGRDADGDDARFHRERPVIGIAGVETMNDAETLAGRNCACRSTGSRRCRPARSTGTT